MSTVHARPGRIGIVSRSASLTSEIVAQTSAAGLGQSTTIGIGGDAVHGLGFAECLEMFMADPETDGVILIGEIGGSEEEQAAAFLRANRATKPVVALVAGRHAPPERRMGHAGTLTVFGKGGAEAKIERAAGCGGAYCAECAECGGDDAAGVGGLGKIAVVAEFPHCEAATTRKAPRLRRLLR